VRGDELPHDGGARAAVAVAWLDDERDRQRGRVGEVRQELDRRPDELDRGVPAHRRRDAQTLEPPRDQCEHHGRRFGSGYTA
jgi:hypothetical protein